MQLKKIIFSFILILAGLSVKAERIVPQKGYGLYNYADAFSVKTQKKIDQAIIELFQKHDVQVHLFLFNDWNFNSLDDLIETHYIDDSEKMILVAFQFPPYKGKVRIESRLSEDMRKVISTEDMRNILERFYFNSLSNRNLNGGILTSIEVFDAFLRGSMLVRYTIFPERKLVADLGKLFLLMLISPFLLVLFYSVHRVDENKYDIYLIKGKYTYQNILELIERIENKFDKNYNSAKDMLYHYFENSLQTKRKFIFYSKNIDPFLVRIMINKRKVFPLFWELSGYFLKIFVVYVYVGALLFCLKFASMTNPLFFYNPFACLLLLIIALVLCFASLSLFMPFLEAVLTKMRSNGKSVSSMSLAVLSVNMLFSQLTHYLNRNNPKKKRPALKHRYQRF